MFNKNVKKLFVLIVLLFIVIFVVGVSYAYTHALFYNRESNTTIAVQGGIMEIIYNDPETGGFSPNIVAEGVIPGWETTKIFTVTGTNDTNSSQEIDTNMYYKVGLKVEENTFSDNALTYSLKANNGDTNPSGQVVQDVNGYIPQTDSVWFGGGYFVPSKKKVVHKYELVVSFPETGENQNIDKGKRFAGYVTVVEEAQLVNVSIKANPDNPELNYTKKLIKNSTIVLEKPEREWHEFIKWHIISGDATISGNKLTVGEDENVEVEALWESNIKEITFLLELDGGSTTDLVNQTVNSYSLITLTPPTKDKHDFMGWELVQGNASINGNYIELKNSNVILKAKWKLIVKDFEFIAATATNPSPYQEFKVPEDGNYKIELWGGAGGRYLSQNGYTSTNSRLGGNGGYAAGIIYLEKDTKLYVYVGGKGSDGKKGIIVPGGWNGGGQGDHDHTDDEAAAGGGGSTDIRIVSGHWSEPNSLRSRIMVAAGGGGAGGGAEGGIGGGLIGQKTTYSEGGTQTSGYSFGWGQDGVYKNKNVDVAGGGGGYYGGYSNSSGKSETYYASGAGGSSFISGHTGAVAIESSTSTSARTGTSGTSCTTGTTDNLCSVHYSGKKFTNTVMIDGAGYSWTNVKDIYTGMPSYSDGTTIVGNTGNGYARITYLGKTLE